MINKKHSLDFLEFPLMVCAPMVDQSQLPFRLLCRKYNTNLCYTPMLHSKMMTTQKKYKQQHFTTCKQDRPLVAQLCGNDPQILLKAAKMVQNQCDAIDLNFGCPQAIAKRGGYGSFLLQQPQLIGKIVKKLSQNLSIPIFCKIRLRKTQLKTFQVVDQIVQNGASLLTVHGRTKQQNKQRVGYCDWKMIKKIKDYVPIPVIANGGIHTFQDVQKCFEQTGVDGVMSSQSLLQNPALFSGKIQCQDKLASQYVDLAEKYPGASPSCIRAHLFKMLHTGLSIHTDLRQKLVKCWTIQQFRQIVNQMKQRRKDIDLKEKLGWYTRYWPRCFIQVGTKMQYGHQGVTNLLQKQQQKKQKKQQKQQQSKTQQVQLKAQLK